VELALTFYQADSLRYYKDMNVSNTDIFLLEPDILLAKKYIEAFNLFGYSVEHFSSAEAAIIASATQRPMVIIIELQLVGHNGIEFIQELRSYPDLDRVSLVINTFIPEHELGLSAHDKQLLGIAEFCYKPQTSIDHLMRIVKGQVLK
jgi:ActR/RegA family two-component response regulator